MINPTVFFEAGESVSNDLFQMSDELKSIRMTSSNRIPYPGNIMEKHKSNEPFTSWAIATILGYKLNGSSVILKSFANTFLKSLGFDESEINNPEIIAEREGRIDVLIKEKDYCIIIENKLKGAGYQQNQLARYIKREEKYKKDKVFIVLLPNDCFSTERYANSIRKSVWKLPQDYEKANGQRQCSVDYYQCLCDTKQNLSKDQCLHCSSCISYETYISRTVTIHSRFADWLLEECLMSVPEEESILRSLIIQLADYLKLQYNTRESEKLKKEIIDYLCKKLNISNENGAERNLAIINDSQKDLERLLADLGDLRHIIYGEQIKEWYNTLRGNPQFGNLVMTDDDSFGICLDGIWCGCGYKDNNDMHPYWGFWKADFTEEEVSKVKKLLEACGMADDGIQENDFIRWANTDEGDQVCSKFYYSGRRFLNCVTRAKPTKTRYTNEEYRKAG